MKKIMFLLILINLKCTIYLYAQWVSTQDSLALVELYDSTNGDNWRNNHNWKTTQPVSTWVGVGVSNNRVVSLYFAGNNMIGYIPGSFGNLTGLRYLNLIDNGLKADLTSFLGNLASLISFHVGEFNFTNEIPESVSNLVNLREFTIYGSYNLHRLPSSLKQLQNLTTLDIGYNSLLDDISEAIPSGLTGLYIYYNNLTFTSIEKLAQRYGNNDSVDFAYGAQGSIPVIKEDDKLIVKAGGTTANNTYKWYKVGTGLVVTNTGDSIFRPSSPGVYYVEVTNALANLIILYSDTAHALSAIAQTCPGTGSVALNAGISGGSFQWQASSDSVNFLNIPDNLNYSGTNTATLTVSNIPASWRGYRYRCIVNGVASIFFTITFNNNWAGTINSTWEDPNNWSCGTTPDESTDVVIQSGSVVVNSNVVVNSLKLMPGASLSVNTGYTLLVKR